MQAVHSSSLADFASIYDERVELVTVSQTESASVADLTQDLGLWRQIPSHRWIQKIGDAEGARSNLPAAIEGEARSTLIDQINEASQVMGALLGCEAVGIRLEALNGPMCPRFHADQVPCRLLITLCGEGTEWIRNGDVDWNIFRDLSQSATPIQPAGEIQNLGTGDWSLLKGGAWQDGFSGVIHRSPNTTGRRLLLSLDPVFEHSEEPA